ncbi:hypothetical protein [Microvirga flavescens]|uniref:hypothetical protein n=1 Tax=Microvirga flavescens TaxID=2249811 RepID=UPI001300262C|nr:hypothetical protein [Microvirga flavescens]
MSAFGHLFIFIVIVPVLMAGLAAWSSPITKVAAWGFLTVGLVVMIKPSLVPGLRSRWMAAGLVWCSLAGFVYAIADDKKAEDATKIVVETTSTPHEASKQVDVPVSPVSTAVTEVVESEKQPLEPVKSEAQIAKERELAAAQERRKEADDFMRRLSDGVRSATYGDANSWLLACYGAMEDCLDRLDGVAMLISARKHYDLDPTQRKAFDNLLQQVVKFQRAAFSKLRERYVREAAKDGWIQDIDVKGSGSGTTVVTYIHARFSSNQYIAEAQRVLAAKLTRYRFREVRYKWYEGASQLTYYKLTAPDDGVIARWSRGNESYDVP